MWDADAGEPAHRTGAWICNRLCPARSECFAESEVANRAEGLWAGMMWDGRGKCTTVEEYHSLPGRRAALIVSLEPDATSRVCARPACEVEFVVAPTLRHQKYCTVEHGNQTRLEQRAAARRAARMACA